MFRVIDNPRAILLSLVAIVMVSVFGIAEAIVSPHLDGSEKHAGAVDLLGRLSLVAALVCVALSVGEWLRLRGDLAPGPAPSAGDRDPVTGLPRRFAFETAVDSAVKAGRGGAVLVISVSGLPASAAEGHGGIVAQKELAYRLTGLLPQDGLLAALPQIGFAMLLPPDASDSAGQIADAVVETCRAPVTIGLSTLRPLAHVGLFYIDLSAMERSEQVMRAACIALDAAKAAQDVGVVVYDSRLETVISDHDTISRKLPRAIYDRRLDVYLQPRIELDGLHVLGFEALVRWSFEGRLIGAPEIIAAARQSGVMVELDTFMMDEAVRLVADWNRRRKTQFSLSVNMSCEHFLSSSGTAFIRDTLEAHEYPADLLTVEISETALPASRNALVPGLSRLRALGCRLSIDDFGAGRTALADLRNLPADEIKIDGSLVDDLEASPDGQAILGALLKMAKELNIDTVVEGVERSAQADALIALGCAGAQGYHYGKPRPATEWLADVTFGRAPDTREVT